MHKGPVRFVVNLNDGKSRSLPGSTEPKWLACSDCPVPALRRLTRGS
jgi:hypothetical protein